MQLGIKEFTQESLLGEPVEHTGQFTLNVTPVGDDVDIETITNVVGNEGQAIDISLGAQILDKAPSLPVGRIKPKTAQKLYAWKFPACRMVHS